MQHSTSLGRGVKTLLIGRAIQFLFAIVTIVLLGYCSGIITDHRWYSDPPARPESVPMTSAFFTAGFNVIFTIFGIIAALQPEKLHWKVMTVLDGVSLGSVIGALVCTVYTASVFEFQKGVYWWTSIATSSCAVASTATVMGLSVYMHAGRNANYRREGWPAGTPKYIDDDVYPDVARSPVRAHSTMPPSTLGRSTLAPHSGYEYAMRDSKCS
ncbi:uncharacterized protein LTR77_006968 [Saxophila tyrrhenica]|uniref:Uncharacterized protein n=1 Tax=Saxophila tyrrhenica TaxID=1690608 RepID=A0AAV9PA57_9PEZI|nr:hypothetical protein LTR77_006968 [Saxophila tyrrhenica]